MSWNYRVIKNKNTFGVHETYYKNGVANAISVEHIAPHGETYQELVLDMVKFQQAFTKPILNYEDFKNELNRNN